MTSSKRNTNNNSSNTKKKRIIGRTWLATSSYSVILTLPKHLAERHGLDEPCHVIFEDTPDGILVRKLEID